jgi:hypothetical protein
VVKSALKKSWLLRSPKELLNVQCTVPTRVWEDAVYCVCSKLELSVRQACIRSQFTNHPEVRHLEIVFKLVMSSHFSHRRLNLAIGIHECVNDLVGHLCSSLKRAISKIVSRAELGSSPPGNQ